MAEEGRQVALFNRQIEVLGKSGQSIASIAAATSDARERMVKDWKEATDAVADYVKMVERASAAIAENRAANAAQDDPGLKHELMDIDTGDGTPAEKAERKRQVQRKFDRGRESGAITAADADAARLTAAAATAREKKDLKEQELEGTDAHINYLAKAADDTAQLLKQQEASSPAILEQLNKDIAAARYNKEDGTMGGVESWATALGVGIFAGGVRNRTAPELEAEYKVQQKLLDDARALKRADDQRLKDAEDARAKVNSDASGFAKTAKDLDEKAIVARDNAGNLRHRFANERVSREGFEDREAGWNATRDSFAGSVEAARKGGVGGTRLPGDLDTRQELESILRANGRQGDVVAVFQAYANDEKKRLKALTDAVQKLRDDLADVNRQQTTRRYY